MKQENQVKKRYLLNFFVYLGEIIRISAIYKYGNIYCYCCISC